MTDKPAEDDIELVIEPDKPEVPAVEAKPALGPQIEPDAAFAKLRADLEADNLRLKSEADAANRRAQAAEGSAVQAKTAAQQSDLQMVAGAIDAVKLTEENLKRVYAEAASNGDWEGAANAQAEMAKNAAKLIRLEEGKAQLEKAPKPQAPAPVANDPVEAIATQLSPKSAQWVRSHPEFVRDPRLNRKLLAAHNLAEADGLALDSPEYFAAVEGTLGLRIPGDKPVAAVEVDDNALSEAAAPSRAPAAAPVSRGNGAKRVVRLTSAQVEAAELSGMTVQAYAEQLERIEQEKAAQRLN